MDKDSLYQKLGQIIIHKLRDENFAEYQGLKTMAQSVSKDAYFAQERNPNYAPDLQQLDDERFLFLNGLSPEQLVALDRLILKVIDGEAFNFLREIEENLGENQSLGLTIEGQAVEELEPELHSGTLFGEYFLWAERFSRFGPYQH